MATRTLHKHIYTPHCITHQYTRKVLVITELIHERLKVQHICLLRVEVAANTSVCMTVINRKAVETQGLIAVGYIHNCPLISNVV